MWLFSKHGFFSAIEHFENADVIHVRARFKGDLERLCAAYGLAPKVTHTPENDYPYRMDFPRAQWVKIVAGEAESIDYYNFKNAVHDGTPRDGAYLNVWSALRRAQG